MVELVKVVDDFLDRKESSTGTGKYKVLSTGDELYFGNVCIAMWQESRVLVERENWSRSSRQCKELLRYMAFRRSILHINEC